MQKAILTSRLVARRMWYSEHDPLSFIKQAAEDHPTWVVEDIKTEKYNDTTIITIIVIKICAFTELRRDGNDSILAD